ncbi:hypothetical protein AURDEDRAFT_172232 [Auricularia subglabra TFB-10046 SS5]|nr:hypothetical protein AURDEDRAFT_172232 [Auricularia subglabra TFB-10046 SS5]
MARSSPHGPGTRKEVTISSPPISWDPRSLLTTLPEVSAAAWLIYDVLLTLPLEVKHIWRQVDAAESSSSLTLPPRREITLPQALYFIIRYYAVAFISCDIFYKAEALGLPILALFVNVLLALRLHAIYYDRRVTIGLVVLVFGVYTLISSVLVLSLEADQSSFTAAPTTVSMVISAHSALAVKVLPTPPELRRWPGCFSVITSRSPRYTTTAWAVTFVADSVFFGMTLYKQWKLRVDGARVSGVLAIFVRDGAMFFGMIFALELANTLINALVPIGPFIGAGSPTEDSLSEQLRRMKRRRDLAAQLPTEVQLQVFHFLRTRALFGANERLSDPSPYSSAIVPFSAARDLAAARAVCRMWHDAATEAMYYDVVLFSATACIAFANSLLTHADLAPLVKRVVLPEISYRLEHVRSTHWNEPLQPGGRHQWQELKDAVTTISIQCSNAADWTFFHFNSYINAVTGLVHQLSPGRARHLAIRSALRELKFDTSGRQDVFYLSATLHDLAHLESFALHRSRLRVTSSPVPLATLHTLRLSTCTMRLDALTTFLTCLPNLRTLDWRDSAFDDVAEVALSTMLASHLSTLVDCTVIPPEHSPASILLGDLSPFVSLRSLALRADMLPQLDVTPPRLERLVVSFGPWPGYSNSRISLFRVHWRRNIFDAAHALMRGVPRWREFHSPALREIQLWDSVLPWQMATWTIASFLLRQTLSPSAVEVAVNLFLAKDEDVRANFQWRRMKRWLLWQGVL